MFFPGETFGVCQDPGDGQSGSFSLVERFREDKQVKSLTTFGVLLRVLQDQCDVSSADEGPAEIALKEPKEISSSSLQNPSDPDAGYDARKGQGYQVQVMETYCDSPEEGIREKTLNLITHVEVEPAHVSDAHALIPALESTKERGLAPEEVLADSLYGSDENHEKAKEMGVDVISPVMGTPKEETLSLADFPQTDTGKIAACPQGMLRSSSSRGKREPAASPSLRSIAVAVLSWSDVPSKPGRSIIICVFTSRP